MKYVIGASIGGLFGISVPMMIDTREVLNNEVPRIEDSQPVEEVLPKLQSENMQQLPDNACRYIKLKPKDIKEQAKECLEVEIPAIPAI
tara:strand:- start:65 stop:331 length:267 start_codon:yes stop_codon:yes gene_type:complete